MKHPSAITLVRGVILAAMSRFIEAPGWQQPHLLDDHAVILASRSQGPRFAS